MANPVTISTNRLIKRLYKETLQFTRKKYRDDAWQNANEALGFVRNFDGVLDMSVWDSISN